MLMNLVKLEPQPPREASYKRVYCDPYNGDLEKWTFWTYDNKMCLYSGNMSNSSHWKPPYPNPLAVTQINGVWYWVYKASIKLLGGAV